MLVVFANWKRALRAGAIKFCMHHRSRHAIRVFASHVGPVNVFEQRFVLIVPRCDCLFWLILGGECVNTWLDMQ